MFTIVPRAMQMGLTVGMLFHLFEWKAPSHGGGRGFNSARVRP
jgi:hypothetical protein